MEVCFRLLVLLRSHWRAAGDAPAVRLHTPLGILPQLAAAFNYELR
jgi:hypothetical protein